MSIELKDGEPRAAFDACVYDVMRSVKLHRPHGVDSRLISTRSSSAWLWLRGLSRHTSCSVLVSTLLQQRQRLSNVNNLSTELAAEDMNREAPPAMYGPRR